jgi:glutamate racemase
MRIIDSAGATAGAVATLLPRAATPLSPTPDCEFYATDSIAKFQRLGSAFLGHPLPNVHLLDLGG